MGKYQIILLTIGMSYKDESLRNFIVEDCNLGHSAFLHLLKYIFYNAATLLV